MTTRSASPFARVLVTAGPTREFIDDVRFLSNLSTGRFGFALAEVAAAAGAAVTLIAGPTPLPPPANPEITVIDVVTALEMRAAVDAAFDACDLFLSVGAVADYRPALRHDGKWKKGAEPVAIELLPNPDILAEMGARKRSSQIAVGFALEVQDAEANARAKMTRKQCDAIVLNRTDNLGAGTGGCTLITPDDSAVVSGTDKSEMARRLWDLLAARFGT